jgi:secretion/DNA translocation related CpaE-like protein
VPRRTGPAAPAARGRVLAVSDDPDLRAALLAACQDAGVAASTDPPDTTRWWAAPLVLLDARSAGTVRHLPRRRGVVVVTVPGAGTRPDATTDPGSGPGVEPTAEVWRAAVAVGAEHVVVLPVARAWLVTRLRRSDRPRGRCVAVVGARGGAGATSTAIALATAGADAGHRVLLVDTDPLGGGIDLALGAEELPGLRWSDLRDVRGPLPPGGLAASLPLADGVGLLSHGRDAVPVTAAAASAVLEAALDEHDLVVVDLPRGGDEAATAAAAAADVLVCVCPAEVRAGAGAPAVLRRWTFAAQVHLLVRGPSPGGLRPHDAAAAVRAGLALLEPAGALHDPSDHAGGRGATGGAGGGRGLLDRVDVVRAEPGLAGALERGEAFATGSRSPLRRWASRWLADQLPRVDRAAA